MVRGKGFTGTIFHIPTYSFKEVVEYFCNSQQLYVLQFLFDVFGGSLRLIKGVLTAVEENLTGDISKRIDDELSFYFGDELEGNKSLKECLNTPNKLVPGLPLSLWSNCVFAITNMLAIASTNLGQNDLAQVINRSMFRHFIVDEMFAVVHESWASGFMKALAGNIIEDCNTNILVELRGIFGGCGMGVMFERHAFREMFDNLKNGKEYHVAKMFDSGTTRSGVVLNVKIKRRVFLRSIEDIKQLQIGEIGVPTVPNFLLVDFIIKPNWFLQMTEAENIHVGAFEKLGKLREALGGKFEDQKMLFVLNNEKNYSAFKFSKDLRGILQFKVGVGLTVPKKRKRNVKEDPPYTSTLL